jgi:hypothetical protein
MFLRDFASVVSAVRTLGLERSAAAQSLRRDDSQLGPSTEAGAPRSTRRLSKRYISLQTTTSLQQLESYQSAIISSWDRGPGTHRVRKIPARKILLLIFGICCASTAAFAENALGFYFGAEVGESEVRRDGYYGPYFDEHHFAWKAIAGFGRYRRWASNWSTSTLAIRAQVPTTTFARPIPTRRLVRSSALAICPYLFRS